MINRKLDDNYREKRFIFIKYIHCTNKNGGAESAHEYFVTVINRIQNTAPVD